MSRPSGEEIDGILARTRADHGAWTAHDIDLGDGRRTIDATEGAVPSADSARLGRVLRIVEELAGRPIDELRVLDLGALEGLFAIELAKRGAHTVAVEARADNAARIRAGAHALGLGDRVVTVEADIRSADLAALGRFDVILCLGLLYHLDEAAALALPRRLRAICDGFLVVDTHVALGDQALAAAAPADLRADPARDLGGLRTAYDDDGHAYRGRTFFEHPETSTEAERLASAWSSLQPASFWLEEDSLARLLVTAGFGSVYAPMQPPVHDPVDRRWLVALPSVAATVPTRPAPPRPDPPMPLPLDGTHPATVVVLGIIDWDFRWQRPQQLLSRVAATGRTVLHVGLPRGDAAADGIPAVTTTAVADGVLEVHPHLSRPLDMYARIPDAGQVEELAALVRGAVREHGIDDAALLVQLPSWTPVALALRAATGWPLVYDCMDAWDGFPGIAAALPDAERALVAAADGVTVSARALWDAWSPANGRITLVRNGADPEHYAVPPAETPLAGVDGPVVGYIGAIASWVDVELVARTAKARPDWTFVLVGGIFDVDETELAALPNVRLEGQRPYALMPAYVQRFDVCWIPFAVDAITAAVDPVKLYEYFSLGKPVVVRPLPEAAGHRDLLYEAQEPGDVLPLLERALAEDDPDLRARRRAAAEDGSWRRRADGLVAALQRASEPGYRQVRRRALGSAFHDLHRVLVVGDAAVVHDLVTLAPELLRPAADGPAADPHALTAVLSTSLDPAALRAAAACARAAATTQIWALHDPTSDGLPATGGRLLEAATAAAGQAGFALLDRYRVMWAPDDPVRQRPGGIRGRADAETRELLVRLAPLDAPATWHALQDQVVSLRRQLEAIERG